MMMHNRTNSGQVPCLLRTRVLLQKKTEACAAPVKQVLSRKPILTGVVSISGLPQRSSGFS